MLPNKLFRFNGDHWMVIPKETTDTYLDNEEYLDYLKTASSYVKKWNFATRVVNMCFHMFLI